MEAITLLAPPNREGRSAPAPADSGLCEGWAAASVEEGAGVAAVAAVAVVAIGDVGASKRAATALAAEGPGRIGVGGGLLPNRDVVPAPPCGSSPRRLSAAFVQNPEKQDCSEEAEERCLGSLDTVKGQLPALTPKSSELGAGLALARDAAGGGMAADPTALSEDGS